MDNSDEISSVRQFLDRVDFGTTSSTASATSHAASADPDPEVITRVCARMQQLQQDLLESRKTPSLG